MGSFFQSNKRGKTMEYLNKIFLLKERERFKCPINPMFQIGLCSHWLHFHDSPVDSSIFKKQLFACGKSPHKYWIPKEVAWGKAAPLQVTETAFYKKGNS